MRQSIDVRELNRWLYRNVPFWSQCRKERSGYVISADTGTNLHPYADRIADAFNVTGIRADGLSNYLTIPYYP